MRRPDDEETGNEPGQDRLIEDAQVAAALQQITLHVKQHPGIAHRVAAYAKELAEKEKFNRDKKLMEVKDLSDAQRSALAALMEEIGKDKLSYIATGSEVVHAIEASELSSIPLSKLAVSVPKEILSAIEEAFALIQDDPTKNIYKLFPGDIRHLGINNRDNKPGEFGPGKNVTMHFRLDADGTILQVLFSQSPGGHGSYAG